MKKVPISYLPLHGCHDCKFVFKKCEYDEAPDYFCAFGKEVRPRCGSTLMDESWFGKEPKVSFDKALDDWEQWSEFRLVQPWGVCNEWREK